MNNHLDPLFQTKICLVPYLIWNHYCDQICSSLTEVSCGYCWRAGGVGVVKESEEIEESCLDSWLSKRLWTSENVIGSGRAERAVNVLEIRSQSLKDVHILIGKTKGPSSSCQFVGDEFGLVLLSNRKIFLLQVLKLHMKIEDSCIWRFGLPQVHHKLLWRYLNQFSWATFLWKVMKSTG